MTGALTGAIPMSEAEYHRAQAEETVRAKRRERMSARAYVRAEYQRHGMNEAERDEVLAMLGIVTDEDIDIPYSDVAQRTSTLGLVKYAGKSVVPRTPPMRAS